MRVPMEANAGSWPEELSYYFTKRFLSSWWDAGSHFNIVGDGAVHNQVIIRARAEEPGLRATKLRLKPAPPCMRRFGNSQ